MVEKSLQEAPMSVATLAPRVEGLEERLTRGAELLFDMEQRGDTGVEYLRWLQHWLHLLDQYEHLQAAF
jgi:hypothetical protein